MEKKGNYVIRHHLFKTEQGAKGKRYLKEDVTQK